MTVKFTPTVFFACLATTGTEKQFLIPDSYSFPFTVEL